jgi:hypothetical protein
MLEKIDKILTKYKININFIFIKDKSIKLPKYTFRYYNIGGDDGLLYGLIFRKLIDISKEIKLSDIINIKNGILIINHDEYRIESLINNSEDIINYYPDYQYIGNINDLKIFKNYNSPYNKNEILYIDKFKILYRVDDLLNILEFDIKN